MITRAMLQELVAGLRAADLDRWVAEAWVRPERRGTEYVFREIDVARVRLVMELRDELALGEEAMPVVLSLLDQLYATRRQMRLLCEAIEQAPEELRRVLAERLGGDASRGEE